jgi:hypothetical protein
MSMQGWIEEARGDVQRAANMVERLRQDLDRIERAWAEDWAEEDWQRVWGDFRDGTRRLVDAAAELLRLEPVYGSWHAVDSLAEHRRFDAMEREEDEPMPF